MKLHIGDKIRERATELRMGPTELAGKIDTSKQNVYGIYKRKSIDTELLRKLSKALEYDFFKFYRYHDTNLMEDPEIYEKGPAVIIAELKNKSKRDGDKMRELRDKVRLLEEQNSLLQKINGLLEEKSRKKK